MEYGWGAHSTVRSSSGSPLARSGEEERVRFLSIPGRYATGVSVLALALPMGGPASAGEDVTASVAFETLKSLEGRWEDTTSEDGTPGMVEIRVSAAGHTILQTDFPGTSREMLTTYHLDGTDLVRKHYCVMGNQPEMRLDVESSTPNVLRFVFAGGTNLDPAKDIHVHNGEIRILDDDRIEAVWAVHGNGKKTGTNAFFLKRKEE